MIISDLWKNSFRIEILFQQVRGMRFKEAQSIEQILLMKFKEAKNIKILELKGYPSNYKKKANSLSVSQLTKIF